MPSPSSLSDLAALVRRVDPDRFLTALFAPPARREALFTLYAFNHETARAHETTREPMMALIRLQWWREVVEGADKSHEVATPLSALLREGDVDPALLLSVLDAREITELETVGDWRDWLIQGPGALAEAAGQALGAQDDRLRGWGAGYGAAGVLRSVVAHARAGRCLLPRALLAQHGLIPEDVIADPRLPALAPVLLALRDVGRSLLGPRAGPGLALSAALPAVLARRDLRRDPRELARGEMRGFGDRFAVIAAATLRHI